MWWRRALANSAPGRITSLPYACKTWYFYHTLLLVPCWSDYVYAYVSIRQTQNGITANRAKSAVITLTCRLLFPSVLIWTDLWLSELCWRHRNSSYKTSRVVDSASTSHVSTIKVIYGYEASQSWTKLMLASHFYSLLVREQSLVCFYQIQSGLPKDREFQCLQ